MHTLLDRSTEALRRYQDRKLTWLLRDVFSHNSLSANQRWVTPGNLTDPRREFCRIPLLEKTTLQRMVQNFVSSGIDPEEFFRVQTTGSTGVPLEMYFDRSYFISFYSRFLYFLHRNKMRPAPFTVSLMSLSVSPKALYDEDNYWFIQPALNFTMFHRVNLRSNQWKSPAEVVEFIVAKQPMTIRAVPSTLEVLADYIHDYSGRSEVRPRFVISTAETLLPSTRRRLESVFHATIVDEYGLSEVGGIVAQECGARQGFHINVQDYYVEVVDREGKSLSDGTEGEIVITNLYQTVVPLLRYRTGDYATIISEPCACGAVSPRLIRLAGRRLSRFKLSNGDSYNPFEMYREFLLSLPVERFQLVQEDLHNVTLTFVGDSRIAESPLIEGLRSKLRQLHSGSAALRLQQVTGFQSRRKFQVFLSRIE